MDKEHEIPEYLRQAIKDADTEKQVKEIFEKAYGLDVVKPRFKETREKLQTVEQRLAQRESQVQQVIQLAKQGDVRAISKLLGISKEKVFQYALQELQYEELPPEQKAQYEQQQQEREELARLRQENQRLAKDKDSTLVQVRIQQLDSLLATGEVKQVAGKMDALFAQQGAKNFQGQPKTFRDLVMEQGFLISEMTGKDATPEQALQAAMALAIREPSAATQAPTPSIAAAPESAAAKSAAQATPPPVIPNIAGKGASPTRKSPKSIADLKKLHAEMSDN
jgi:hypothetical protein